MKTKCRYIIENNCDLVNYSFGEPINYCNSGPNLFFAEDLIEKYGVIVCASAGNKIDFNSLSLKQILIYPKF